jgi:hypothetical protein
MRENKLINLYLKNSYHKEHKEKNTEFTKFAEILY